MESVAACEWAAARACVWFKVTCYCGSTLQIVSPSHAQAKLQLLRVRQNKAMQAMDTASRAGGTDTGPADVRVMLPMMPNTQLTQPSGYHGVGSRSGNNGSSWAGGQGRGNG